MKKINCLPVNVYKNPSGDCTNRGISSRFRELLVYCPDGHESFDSEKETPLNFCMVERQTFFGGRTANTVIVPAMVDDAGNVVKRPGWWMYGGNIADTSDSRFTQLKGGYYPLHIHDRKEAR